MALSRSLFFLHRPSLAFPSNSTLLSLNYPSATRNFTLRPILQQNLKSLVPTTRCSSSSMEAPPQGYRRNVGICLINPSKKIFAATRLDIPDAWQMPQVIGNHPFTSLAMLEDVVDGGIDEDEDPKTAASRELKEETGVSSAEVLAEVPYWLTYDFPPEVREKLRQQWGSDWKGQAQKWFLLKFTGKEDEINLLGDGTEKPEFGGWSWMSPDQIIEHAVDFKKSVYRDVLAVFAPYLE